MSDGAGFLQVRGLELNFGAVRALAGVDLDCEEGELLGIIGANGSGKTTLFNCVTGFLKPRAGRVRWQGRDVTRWQPHRIAKAGIVRTFQQPMMFASGTTRQNIEMAISIGGGPSDVVSIGDRVDELLDEVGLADAAETPAALLPYGSLRQLGVGMALAARPRLLLLDEPAAGLNDGEAAVFGKLLTAINRSGVTLVVVDHDMGFLMPLVGRVVVLDAGRKLAEGTPSQVQREPAVIEAYLGSRFAVEKPEPAAAARGPVEAGNAEPLLEVKGLRVAYGAVEAVRGIDFEVRPGEAVAILGPNGAGKTTLLRAISRMLPYRGSVLFGGRLLAGEADAVARQGIAHVLEGRRIFSQLTVRENLLVPRLARREPGFDEDLAQVLDMFPILRVKLDSLGGELSGGQQQSLAIARALLMRPRLLLMDEPSLGLAPVVVDQVSKSAAHLREHWKVSLLVAEQSLSLVMEVADRYYLMRRGVIVHAGRFGTPEAREEVLRAYLGEGSEEAVDGRGGVRGISPVRR